MKAVKTREYLQMALGNISHADRELQEEIKKELSELERLAEIGKRVEQEEAWYELNAKARLKDAGM